MIEKERKLSYFFFEKYLSYELYIGGILSSRSSKMKGYVKGFRSNFCVYDLNIVQENLRSALNFLFLAVVSDKKILFIGAPLGLERDFSLLCRKYRHYHLSSYTDGLFTNFDKSLLDYKRCPALVFCFSLTDNGKVKKEIRKWDVPIMAVVRAGDDCDGIDFCVPIGLDNWRASLYLYNLLSLIFSLKRWSKRRKKFLKCI